MKNADYGNAEWQCSGIFMAFHGIELGLNGIQWNSAGDFHGISLRLKRLILWVEENATLPWTVETLEILGEICSINWCGFVLSTRW